MNYSTKMMQQGGEAGVADQIPQMAAQALQSNDPQLAMQVCQMIVEMMGGAGGQQPAPEQAPQPPMMKRGGKLIKKKKGGKMKKTMTIEGDISKVEKNIEKAMEAKYGMKFMSSQAGKDMKENMKKKGSKK